ncbi:hypothetical protein EDD17DRAFT_367647 [Pisolithus thermaeus]|nr:hypothetical protein EDD17DRAFT_367647 [Pisolithus thermaeus]
MSVSLSVAILVHIRLSLTVLVSPLESPSPCLRVAVSTPRISSLPTPSSRPSCPRSCQSIVRGSHAAEGIKRELLLVSGRDEDEEGWFRVPCCHSVLSPSLSDSYMLVFSIRQRRFEVVRWRRASSIGAIGCACQLPFLFHCKIFLLVSISNALPKLYFSPL